jgi:GNAT superfamily N-acetyltransferase
MRYRLATVDDAWPLARMNWRLIRDEGHRNAMSEHELHARMKQWLAGEYDAVVFEDEAGSAGYALYRRDDEYLYVRHFFVAAARRRQGIGRAAVEHLVQNFWTDRVRVRIEVLSNNAAGIAFWRSVGFVDYCLTMERAR